jgi:GR25 family glycosyltransferase involved in LPS biosynthesis
MNYAGYFINLDRSRERRTEIEQQLAALKLDAAYQRFKAADGNTLKLPNPHLKNGEMGCFISHYLLMKKTMEKSEPLHVIEDDVLLSQQMVPVLDATIAAGELERYDIIFTDTYVPINVDGLRFYKSLYDQNVVRDAQGKISDIRFSIIDLAGRLFATTSSYLIGPRSLRKLYNIYTKELNAGARVPIDLFIRNKAAEGVIKVGCIFPFITSVRLEHSSATTIDGRADLGRHDRLTVLAGDVARQSFFIEGDWSRCQDYVETYLRLPRDDAHHRLLGDILRFGLTEGYQAI